MNTHYSNYFDGINQNIEQIIREYQGILASELYHYFTNKSVKLIINNQDIFSQEYSLNDYFDILLSDALKTLNINSQEIKSKKDIKILYNYLIEVCIDNIKKKLSVYNKNDIYFILYCLASYMAELHGRINALIDGTFSIPNMGSIDNIEYIILTSIQSLKTDNLGTASGIIGTDKAIIQYLFEILPHVNFSANSDGEKNIELAEIIRWTYVLTRLVGEREILESRFNEKNKIKIIDNKIILSDEIKRCIRDLNQDLLINEKKLSFDYITPNILDKLNQGLIENIGFSVYTLNKFIDSKEKVIEDGDLCIPVTREMLIHALTKKGVCSSDEAVNLIDYLTFGNNGDINKLYESIDNYTKRVFENPLVKVELFGITFFLLSYAMLIYASEILHKKLIYNLIPECQKSNSRFIENSIKNEPVKRIKSLLEKKRIKTFDNFQDFIISINGKNQSIHLEREIDILCLIEGNLHIIEFKDIQFKFTALGFKRDINKSIDYINTIKKNEEDLIKIKQYLELLFQSNINSITSFLVYRHYNASINSSIDKKGVQIITLRELEKRFSKA